MKESALQKRIITFLKYKNHYVIKIHPDIFSRSGIPDVITCINGEFCAFELKTTTGILSELQKYNLEKIKDSKGHAYSICDFDDFLDIYNKIIKNQKERHGVYYIDV